MRRIRLLGLAFLAIFAVGAITAATASATEAGFLPLEALKEAVKFMGKGTKATTFSAGAGTFMCQSLVVEKGLLGEKGQTHITLGTATLDYKECKFTKGESKIGFNSEGDPKETLLVPVDIHLLNVLEKTTLQPGLVIILLETLKITAGLVKAQIKGNVLGLVLDASGKLTKDTESVELHFFGSTAETCDSEPKSAFEECEKYKGVAYLCKIGESFEPIALEALASLTTVNVGEMFLVDD